MSTPVNMPKLGLSMTEGTLQAWQVEDGAAVGAGQVIAIIETDKVEQELESPAAGTIVLRAESGETYQVGDPLAEIV
jgi:pyruvate/2-oxoglutarate dehydrogenase complex dihydrolipoamide acyltransferase (E2) component